MEKEKLLILWTNADSLMAEMMVFMYAQGAMKKGWWRDVQIVIWGPTAKLVAEDEHIQQLIREAEAVGVKFSACKSCATKLDVVEKLEAINMDMQFWGAPLTENLKDDKVKVLSI